MFRSLTDASFVDALGDDTERGPTSRGRRHPIDWIFVKNGTGTTGGVVHAPSASDHSPLITMVARLSTGPTR